MYQFFRVVGSWVARESEWEYGRREGGEVKRASARCIITTSLSFEHSTNNHSNGDCKRYKTVTKNSQNASEHLWQPQSWNYFTRHIFYLCKVWLLRCPIVNCQIIAETEKVAKQKISLIKSISTSIEFWEICNQQVLLCKDWQPLSSNVLIWAILTPWSVWSSPNEPISLFSILVQMMITTNMMFCLTRHHMQIHHYWSCRLYPRGEAMRWSLTKSHLSLILNPKSDH